MEDTYRTLGSQAEGIFRDRGSRFMAYGYPVSNILDINDILAELRKKYHDARHHCYAYRLGADKKNYRINDDGEPSGTAGKPIFGQLLSQDLTDVLVVVVRYFGGTLLGTSGLINAYRSAAEIMLSNAVIVEKQIEDNFQLSFPYDKLNAVMRVLKEENLAPQHPDYDLNCKLNVTVRKSLSEKVKGRLALIQGLEIKSLSGSD